MKYDDEGGRGHGITRMTEKKRAIEAVETQQIVITTELYTAL
jgi:hypothetical protein